MIKRNINRCIIYDIHMKKYRLGSSTNYTYNKVYLIIIYTYIYILNALRDFY